jgi:4-hydroxy-tetrahydrodipicolinate synthase
MGQLKLEGIFVPNITPFTFDGHLDDEALRSCVRFWMENEVSGLIPCGSNGEAPYLSREERKMVIQTVLDEVKGKILIIVGTGSMSTRETIQFTKDAKDLGADAALIVTPFYFKLSNMELFEHYSAVVEAVDLPVVLYSVPKFTGLHLSTSVIARLESEYENIVGVKDSGDNIGMIIDLIRLVSHRISVLAGTTDVTLATLMLGGRGAVLAVANVLPKMCNNLYRAFNKGDYKEASKLQHRLSYYNEIFVKRYNQLAAIKEALTMRGLPAGHPRRPVLPLNEWEKKEIENIVKTIGEPF